MIDRSFAEPMLSFYILFPFRVSFPFPLDYAGVSKLDVFGTALVLKIFQIYMFWEFWKGKEDGWGLLCSSYFLLEFEFP